MAGRAFRGRRHLGRCGRQRVRRRMTGMTARPPSATASWNSSSRSSCSVRKRVIPKSSARRHRRNACTRSHRLSWRCTAATTGSSRSRGTRIRRPFAVGVRGHRGIHRTTGRGTRLRPGRRHAYGAGSGRGRPIPSPRPPAATLRRGHFGRLREPRELCNAGIKAIFGLGRSRIGEFDREASFTASMRRV